MSYLIPILVLGGLAAVTLLVLWRKKVKKEADAWKWGAQSRARKMVESRAADVVTPNGVGVWFEPGLDKAIDLDAIDRGRENVFRKLECAGYTVDRSRHHAKVAVLASVLSPESHTPSYKEFIAPGNPYFGGEFDMEAGKGEEVAHYVLAAGQMVAVGDPYGDIIAIAHPQGNNVFLETICDYEYEHIGYATYDGNKFEETKTHGMGRSHPIMDSCPGEIRSLMSKPMRFVCGGAVR